MEITLENITLKMWEKTMMSESIFSEEENKYKKTGKKTEQTTYTFVDNQGNKLVFLSANNVLRNKEGETGDLFVALSHDNYNGVNKIQFKGFIDRD